MSMKFATFEIHREAHRVELTGIESRHVDSIAEVMRDFGTAALKPSCEEGGLLECERPSRASGFAAGSRFEPVAPR